MGRGQRNDEHAGWRAIDRAVAAVLPAAIVIDPSGQWELGTAGVEV